MGHFIRRTIVKDGLVFQIDAGNKIGQFKNIVNPTQVGTPINGLPISDGSWDFDGTDDRIDISPTDNNITGLTYGTLSMWFKIPSTTTNSRHGLFTVYESTDFYYSLVLGDSSSVLLDESIVAVLQYGPGEVQAIEYAAAVRKGHTYYFDDTWHNVVFTVDSGPAPNTKLYIDGILQTLSYVYGSDSGTGFTNLSPTHITVGCNYNINIGGYYNHLEGNISSMKIYNKALTQAEVAQNYEVQKHRYL